MTYVYLFARAFSFAFFASVVSSLGETQSWSCRRRSTYWADELLWCCQGDGCGGVEASETDCIEASASTFGECKLHAQEILKNLELYAQLTMAWPTPDLDVQRVGFLNIEIGKLPEKFEEDVDVLRVLWDNIETLELWHVYRHSLHRIPESAISDMVEAEGRKAVVKAIAMSRIVEDYELDFERACKLGIKEYAVEKYEADTAHVKYDLDEGTSLLIGNELYWEYQQRVEQASVLTLFEPIEKVMSSDIQVLNNLSRTLRGLEEEFQSASRKVVERLLEAEHQSLVVRWLAVALVGVMLVARPWRALRMVVDALGGFMLVVRRRRVVAIVAIVIGGAALDLLQRHIDDCWYSHTMKEVKSHVLRLHELTQDSCTTASRETWFKANERLAPHLSAFLDTIQNKEAKGAVMKLKRMMKNFAVGTSGVQLMARALKPQVKALSMLLNDRRADVYERFYVMQLHLKRLFRKPTVALLTAIKSMVPPDEDSVYRQHNILQERVRMLVVQRQAVLE